MGLGDEFMELIDDKAQFPLAYYIYSAVVEEFKQAVACDADNEGEVLAAHYAEQHDIEPPPDLDMGGSEEPVREDSYAAFELMAEVTNILHYWRTTGDKEGAQKQARVWMLAASEKLDLVEQFQTDLQLLEI